MTLYIHTDKDGKIISDTKAERIQRKLCLANGCVDAKDTILNHLLKSYEMAVNEPENEFIHLYEIRETLVSILGGAKQKKKKIEDRRCSKRETKYNFW